MKIESIEFLLSVYAIEQVPRERLPILAFAGRSNVGKSTWINSLAGKKAVARVSRTPGKTQCLNYFLVNGTCYWVDLPGYGYARVSQQQRLSWKKLVEDWFRMGHDSALVLLIVDASIPIQPSDVRMAEWLKHYRLPFVVLANKFDRVRSADKGRTLERLRSTKAFSAAQDIVAVSGRKEEGKHLILEVLRERGLV